MSSKRRHSPAMEPVDAEAREAPTDLETCDAKIDAIKQVVKELQTCRRCGMHRPGCMLLRPPCNHVTCMSCINIDIAKQLMRNSIETMTVFANCNSCEKTALSLDGPSSFTSAPGGQDFMLHKMQLALDPDEEPKYSCPLAHLCQFEPESSLFKFQEHIRSCCISTFRCYRRNARGVKCDTKFSLLDPKTKNHPMQCKSHSCDKCLKAWHEGGSVDGDSLHWNQQWCIDVSAPELKMHKAHSELVQNVTVLMQCIHDRMKSIKKEPHDQRSVKSEVMPLMQWSVELAHELSQPNLAISNVERLVKNFFSKVSTAPACARIAPTTYIRP